MSAGLAKIHGLKELVVKGNRLTSLAGLGACTQLRHLDVSFNSLTSMLINAILPLQHLTHLSLNGNR